MSKLKPPSTEKEEFIENVRHSNPIQHHQQQQQQSYYKQWIR